MPNDSRAEQRCRFALATPPGRGAVASILMSGEDAAQRTDRFFLAASGIPLADTPLGAIAFGHWRLADGREDVVVCRPDERSVEIHCHGGPIVASGVMATLATAGCRESTWQDWLKHEQNTLHVEAAIALAAAQTEQTAAVLLDQLHGALQAEIETILELFDAGAAQERLQRLLANARRGRRLTEPWKIVLAGRPNVGKSSLINALLGFQRVVVHDQPGTTRDVVAATAAIAGWPVVFSDTAGLRSTDDSLEAEGVAGARLQIEQADLVVWVRACGQPDHAEDNEAFRTIAADALLCVRNKSDLQRQASGGEPAPSNEHAPSDGEINTCALSGEGVAPLLEAISRRLGPFPPPGQPTPFTARQQNQLQQAAAALAANNATTAHTCLQTLLAGPISAKPHFSEE